MLLNGSFVELNIQNLKMTKSRVSRQAPGYLPMLCDSRCAASHGRPPSTTEAEHPTAFEWTQLGLIALQVPHHKAPLQSLVDITSASRGNRRLEAHTNHSKARLFASPSHGTPLRGRTSGAGGGGSGSNGSNGVHFPNLVER